MKVEVWTNQYCDTIIFVNNEYVIFDKCDRIEVKAYSLLKDSYFMNKTIEDLKQIYYENGFRPEENTNNYEEN